MRQPTCLLYLPAGLHCKKHLQKKPGHFRVLMTVCGTSSLLKPVFLSAATLGLRACKILPLISLYTRSACLFPFFFFFFPTTGKSEAVAVLPAGTLTDVAHVENCGACS